MERRREATFPGWSAGRARLTLNQDKRRRFDSYPGSVSTDRTPQTPSVADLTVVVLAAGGGTRMRSKTAKVLHPLAGRSMLGHVLAAVGELGPRRVVAVVGHQREQVAPHVRSAVKTAIALEQEGAKLVAASMETMAAAAFVCCEFGRVRAMTARAQDAIARGLPIRVVASYLKGLRPCDDEAIARALFRAIGIGVGAEVWIAEAE